jgi:hypothetical protein
MPINRTKPRVRDVYVVVTVTFITGGSAPHGPELVVALQAGGVSVVVLLLSGNACYFRYDPGAFMTPVDGRPVVTSTGEGICASREHAPAMKLRINRRRARTKLGRKPWAPGAHLGKSGSLCSFWRYRRNRLQTWPETRTWFGELE